MRNGGSGKDEHQQKQAATAHVIASAESDTKLYPRAQHADVADRHHQALNV